MDHPADGDGVWVFLASESEPGTDVCLVVACRDEVVEAAPPPLPRVIAPAAIQWRNTEAPVPHLPEIALGGIVPTAPPVSRWLDLAFMRTFVPAFPVSSGIPE